MEANCRLPRKIWTSSRATLVQPWSKLGFAAKTLSFAILTSGRRTVSTSVFMWTPNSAAQRRSCPPPPCWHR
eukprot:6030875-Lingulodinium_polyedra.AAC.1